MEYTDNGIGYTWEPAGSQGASFILFPGKEHTKEQIDAAKREIRANQDVVRMHLASEEDRDDLYKSEIFAHPKVRGLQWYQVNTDEQLLRKERLKGTTVEDYVTAYVLPFIEETKAKMKERYGDKL